MVMTTPDGHTYHQYHNPNLTLANFLFFFVSWQGFEPWT